MKKFFSKKGKFWGSAWSVMVCENEEEHKPHVYNSEFFRYGPYLCPGYPNRKIYDAPPRTPYLYTMRK